MLYIDDQLPHIQQAKSLHIQNITCYVNRKLYGKTPDSVCKDVKCKICNSDKTKSDINPNLHAILTQFDIKEIAGALPHKLISIHEEFERCRIDENIKLTKNIKSDIEKIFNYKEFIKKATEYYNAYDLTNNLKIETCVYCNRLYTSTVITEDKESIIRPTLDHWFSQKGYPILALSFYNLIPSCSPCNSSVKHASKFTLEKNIHPYVDKLTNDYKLKSTYDTSLSKFKIRIDSKKSRIISTLEEMKIAEIYGHHQSELADLDLLQRKYNKSLLDGLNRLLGTGYSEKDIYRIMFGVEYDDEIFHKRPLSKLKKDILNIEL